MDTNFIILKLKTMKKIFLTTAVASIAGLFISANANAIPGKMDKETRKQMRKEKREERRELWLHSVNAVTEIHFYTDFPNAKDVISFLFIIRPIFSGIMPM
jgi:hypothetical protein